jgi:hypothetical protein
MSLGRTGKGGPARCTASAPSCAAAQEDWEQPPGRSDGLLMSWLRHHDRYGACHHMEPVLISSAAARGAEVMFSTEYLGLPIEGVMGRAATIYTLFNADLTRYVAYRASILHWIMTPGTGFGEIGMGTFRVIRPWHQWIAGWGYDINGPEPDLRPEASCPASGR